MMRARLPSRRSHELIDFEHGGHRFTLGIGRANGAAAEVFLSAARVGSAFEAEPQAAAILTSLLLQHQVSLAVVCHALRGHPASVIGAALSLIEDGEP